LAVNKMIDGASTGAKINVLRNPWSVLAATKLP
jgi:hypothetical protein